MELISSYLEPIPELARIRFRNGPNRVMGYGLSPV